MKTTIIATYLMSSILMAPSLFAQQEPNANKATQDEKAKVAEPQAGPEKTTNQSTVAQVLGADKVDAVVRGAISEANARVSSSYVLTNNAFRRLMESGMSKTELRTLQAMEGERIGGRETFQALVVDKFNPRPGVDLEQIARTSLVVPDDFVKRVETLIMESRAPTPAQGDPKVWLEKNFRLFLGRYIAFVEASSKNQNEIVLNTDRLNEYLKEQRSKCGELSCPGTPPCCGVECDSCNKP